MYTSVTALASSADSCGDSVVTVIRITCVLSTISTDNALINKDVALRFLAARTCSSVSSFGSSWGKNGSASRRLALIWSTMPGSSLAGIKSSLFHNDKLSTVRSAI